MTEVAPFCPVSYGSPIPGARVLLKGDPWHRPKTILELPPRATDLRSAINALNIMSHMVSDIMRTSTVNNNKTSTSTSISETDNGQDYNPNYDHTDWLEESRVYATRSIINPDDPGQSIEVKVLTSVTFYNANTAYRLRYGD